MANIRSTCWAVCFLVSIAVNIYFLGNQYVCDEKKNLTWSQRAAAEAEAVASISCSGHGRAYVDGLLVHGKPVCECNNCYGGPDCSQFLSECPAIVNDGDPMFLEPFWMQHAASSAVMLSGWHRMSYTFEDQSFISQELEKHIRRLHSVAKNADTNGRYIIFGAGSTQLLAAAVYALSKDSSSPTSVVAESPHYPVYKTQADYFQTTRFEFQGDASMLNNSLDDSTNVLEFVTSPSNPEGQLKGPILQGSSVRTIYDHAYYWPHYSAIPAPADGDLMLFTISKFTGHAGSRFGWAMVKDLKVYEKMKEYIDINEYGTSRDTQLRALQIFKVILQDNGKEFFDFAHGRMRERWEKVSQIISHSTRLTLQETEPQFCKFYGKRREPSPAYAWLRCEWKEDQDCMAVLHAANMIGREGSWFNVEDRFVRLSLIGSQDDFDLLLQRLENLVSGEDDLQVM